MKLRIFCPLCSHKLAKYVFICESYHMKLRKCTQSAKLFCYGGGTNGLMGGTQDFPDGGRTDLHGGDKVQIPGNLAKAHEKLTKITRC